MDEAKAIKLAEDFIRCHGIDIKDMHSAQKFSPQKLCREHPLAEFPSGFKTKEDFWIVRFNLRVPDGEIWCPDQVLVEIDDRTEKAVIVPSL